MDYEKLKSAAETITMPEEVKRRIVRNCKTQILNSRKEIVMKTNKNNTFIRKPAVLVAVSEGIRNRRGRLISDTGKVDSFGHPQLGGLAAILSEKINKRLNVKVRGIELSLLQRCAAHCASKTDIEESFAAGKAAVENAVAGITDKMVGYKRRYVNGKYKCQIKLFELTDVANTEKKVPISWINKDNTGMSDKFIKYALPLIEGETDLPKEDGLPRFVNLKKVLVKK